MIYKKINNKWFVFFQNSFLAITIPTQIKVLDELETVNDCTDLKSLLFETQKLSDESYLIKDIDDNELEYLDTKIMIIETKLEELK